jgi:hypothetical protein
MSSKMPIVDLNFLLKNGKNKFIRSESIPARVTVANFGSTQLEIEDLTMLNNPLRFHAIGWSGEKFSGNLLGSLARDGTRIPTPRRKNLITLKPQESKAIDVDLIETLGELPEGNYKIRASYQSMGTLHVGSNTVEIQILKSSPVYSSTVQDYLRMDNPTKTAWINRREDGLYLFIMENSADLPSVLRFNRRILKLEKLARVFLSVPESFDQDYEDIVWFEDDIVHRVTVSGGRFKKKTAVRLPFSGVKLVEPSFTDEDGVLNVVALSKEDNMTVFYLLKIPLNGKAVASELCRHEGKIGKRCVAFDADLRVHLSWASGRGDIFYVRRDLDDALKRKRKAELLSSGMAPPLDLQFSLVCEDDEGNSQVLLHHLNREAEGKLCSHVMNVENRKLVLESFFPVPTADGLEILQVVLDVDCQPHFLFQDRSGALLFKSFMGAEFVKVTEESEVYPGNIDCPVLLVSSKMSRHYGIYLRYVKDNSIFNFKKLQALR